MRGVGSRAGLLGKGGGVVPEFWYPVYFIVDRLIASTLLDRLPVGGRRIGLSSVLVKLRWLDLP